MHSLRCNSEESLTRTEPILIDQAKCRFNPVLKLLRGQEIKEVRKENGTENTALPLFGVTSGGKLGSFPRPAKSNPETVL